MTALIPAFLAGWILTFALLAVEHLLWKDAHLVVRYCLGGGTICTGCSFAGLILNDPVLTFGPWVIASAGIVTAAWTWFEDRAKAREIAATRRGEITGAARGILTQDTIDTGGRGDAQRSRHDRAN